MISYLDIKTENLTQETLKKAINRTEDLNLDDVIIKSISDLDKCDTDIKNMATSESLYSSFVINGNWKESCLVKIAIDGKTQTFINIMNEDITLYENKEVTLALVPCSKYSVFFYKSSINTVLIHRSSTYGRKIKS